MSANTALLAKLHRMESNFNSPKEWPDEEVKEVTQLANRQTVDKFRDSSEEARQLVVRGFSGQVIAEKTGKTYQQTMKVAKKMLNDKTFEYGATKDDLKQLAYNRSHAANTAPKEIARLMGRTSKWVSAMVKRLD